MLSAAACLCQAEQRVITEEQKEHTGPINPINTKVGKAVSITLDSNPTTGYQWQLANPVDEKVLKLISSEYRPPKTKKLGAGGKEVWTFKALSTGQTIINFEYVRPWEKDRGAAEQATFTIKVQ
ncbi:MAG: hypothetical protein C0399_02445 [Syntrophus sp. (in: bacteria)]|nr:hypothetical protein [Syntrophus sp. (in: bacteria)]